MRTFTYGAAAILLAAGCASTPEQAADNGDGRTAQAAAEAATKAIQAANVPDAEPVVLELTAGDVDPANRVTCREMLKPASNVIVTRCLSGHDWKIYERARELWAQEMLRTIQGGAYR
jgi:hypothetical protein